MDQRKWAWSQEGTKHGRFIKDKGRGCKRGEKDEPTHTTNTIIGRYGKKEAQGVRQRLLSEVDSETLEQGNNRCKRNRHRGTKRT